MGDALIKISGVCALIALFAAIRWARGHTAYERTFRWAYHAMTATLIGAAVLLMVAILRHDFRFDYVIGYSSRDLPLLYLISAFWAGQQGTYLLWGLFGALFGYALFRKNAWEPAAVMSFYLPTVAFMHLLMLMPEGNPFRLAPVVPIDGRGLNPLLQDPWMASHPPAVFLGYVAAAVLAALALVALFKRKEGEWLDGGLRWSLMSFILLGTGIILGAFWAYKVLGWGGYWGWDPVENASLIPWIVMIALVHGLIVQRKTGALPRTNLALALAVYATVFYATFLTRSGVLADFSVHSFPAGSIYQVLLGIQLLIVAVALFALIRRWAIDAGGVKIEFSWPLVLATSLVLLMISAAMVTIGTSWPIITSAFGRPSSVNISWYNTVNQPIYILLLGLLGVAPFLAWTLRSWPNLSKRLVPTLAVALIGTVIAVMMGVSGAMALTLLFVSLAALAANAVRFVEVSRARVLHTGAALAHIGFALMFVGIVGSSFWGTGGQVVLPQGEPVEAVGRSFTYLGHVEGSEPEDRWQIRLEEPGSEPLIAEVGMYRTGSARDSQTMHKPAIVRSLAGDLYIAPGGMETRGGAGHHDLTLAKGQPVRLGEAVLTFTGFETQGMGQGGMTVYAHVDVTRGVQQETMRLPFAMTPGGSAPSQAVKPSIDAGITSLELKRMVVEQGTILVHADVPGSGTPTQVFYIDATTKPLIGLLWAGTILLAVGCVLAWVRRVAEQRVLDRAALAAEEAPRQRRRKTRRDAAPRPAHARR